jgi:UDP-GlcNAc:undecaprenyl-phosphate GlcNAc-1-phosphate transferase
MIYLSALLLSFFITVVLIPVFSSAALRFNVGLDLPGPRKVHTVPIPRAGGVALVLGVYVSTVFSLPESGFLTAYAVAAGIIVLFGFFDDLRGLDYRIKFAAQIVAALVMVIYGGVRITNLGSLLPEGMLLSGLVGVPLTVVAIVGVTNAINMSDGLDGLAGGICFLSFCCLAYLAYLTENATVGLLAVAQMGSIMGFLRYNTFPARLFLGDTGSQFLGFSAITLSLSLTQQSTALSPLLPLLILGFPVLDTLSVMTQRLAEKQSVFVADKKHFHHRLLRLGFHHSESVLIIYVIQTVLIVAAYWFRFYSEWAILAAYACLSAAIVVGLHEADRAQRKIRRFDFLERVVKSPLRRMRQEGVFILVSFKTIQYGFPALLFAVCFIPVTIPREFSYFSLALLGLLALTWAFRGTWMRGSLMVVLYLFIPFIVYLSAEQESPFDLHIASTIYELSYVALVIFAVLTLKLTRRQRGFKTTPMDFLILFMAVVFPYALKTYLPVKNMPTIVARTVMFFFGFEVIMGELRGRLNGLALASVPALLTVIVRGFGGW